MMCVEEGDAANEQTRGRGGPDDRDTAVRGGETSVKEHGEEETEGRLCRKRLVGRGAGRWDEREGEQGESSRDDAVVRLQGRRKEEPRREPVPVTGPPAGRRTRHTAPYHPLPLLLFLSLSLSLLPLRPVFRSSHLCFASFGLPAHKCLPRPSLSPWPSSLLLFFLFLLPLRKASPPSRNLSRHSRLLAMTTKKTTTTTTTTKTKTATTTAMPCLPFLKQCQQACSGCVCDDNATGATMFTGPRLYASPRSRLSAVIDIFAYLLFPRGRSRASTVRMNTDRTDEASILSPDELALPLVHCQ